MNKARLKLEHLLNRRAGIQEDYSIPETTTYITASSQSRRREANVASEECAILRI